MNQPNRYLYAEHLHGDFSNIMYWRLLYRAGLLCIVIILAVSGLVKQNGLQQAHYFHMMNITAIVIIPWIMAELILRGYKYPNKRWNSMILLASLMIGLSSIGIFY